MSIAGGLHRALERAQALGCGAAQIFLKNQRQWAAKPLADEEARAFRAARRRTGIRSVFAHASYLINLAAPGDAQWAQAVDAFAAELEEDGPRGVRVEVCGDVGAGPRGSFQQLGHRSLLPSCSPAERSSSWPWESFPYGPDPFPYAGSIRKIAAIVLRGTT